MDYDLGGALATVLANARRPSWQDLQSEDVHACISKCSWGRLCVSTLLVLTVIAWATALQMIEAAANVEERADVPSPRTPWSSRRQTQLAKWFTFQQHLVITSASYEAAMPYDVRSRLALFGDSITEAWQGTSYGEKTERARGVPSVLQLSLAQRWPDPLVLAISGDQTQHLLWRLAHGEGAGPRALPPTSTAAHEHCRPTSTAAHERCRPTSTAAHERPCAARRVALHATSATSATLPPRLTDRLRRPQSRRRWRRTPGCCLWSSSASTTSSPATPPKRWCEGSER